MIVISTMRGEFILDESIARRLVQFIIEGKNMYTESSGHDRLFVAGFQQALAHLKEILEDRARPWMISNTDTQR